MIQTASKQILDIGCGDKKIAGSVGMDNRLCAGVDFVHSLEETPWPFDDAEFYAINASHILEHVKPWKIIEVMDEAWRVLQVGGGMDVRVPVGLAYRIDPTHCIEWNVPMFWYFDSSKDFYKTYQPRPWKILHSEVDPSTQELRTILQKELHGIS